jgi:hypothetical protein
MERGNGRIAAQAAAERAELVVCLGITKSWQETGPGACYGTCVYGSNILEIKVIISHAHRFIFLKTRKTAGTSVEAMLSRFCGPDDVITPISEPDEIYRQGRGPQNWTRCASCSADETEAHYYNHINAELVRRYAGEAVWNSYFKFSIERNPWDREISNYFWMYRDEMLPFRPEGRRPLFEEYILTPETRMLGNFGIYSFDGKIVMDFICRYETLEANLRTALEQVGITAPFELPRAKSDTRTDHRDWREFYTPRTRDIIAKAHAREIASFGYAF